MMQFTAIWDVKFNDYAISCEMGKKCVVHIDACRNRQSIVKLSGFKIHIGYLADAFHEFSMNKVEIHQDIKSNSWLTKLVEKKKISADPHCNVAIYFKTTPIGDYALYRENESWCFQEVLTPGVPRFDKHYRPKIMCATIPCCAEEGEGQGDVYKMPDGVWMSHNTTVIYEHGVWTRVSYRAHEASHPQMMLLNICLK